MAELIKRDSGYAQINTRVSNTNEIVVDGGVSKTSVVTW